MYFLHGKQITGLYSEHRVWCCRNLGSLSKSFRDGTIWSHRCGTARQAYDAAIEAMREAGGGGHCVAPTPWTVVIQAEVDPTADTQRAPQS